MVRCVRQAPRHHPCSRALDIEEGRQLLPPSLVLVPKRLQALPTVLSVTFHELEAGFRARQRWSANVDAEHVAKPVVLADALVNHLLVHAASAVIVLVRSDGEIA